MKKVVSILLVFALSLTVFFSLAACDLLDDTSVNTDEDTDTVCTHKAVTDEGYAATCTKNGLTDGSHCSKCGKTLTKQKTIPALGHTEKDGVCTVCHEVIDAEEALACYIMKEGTETDTGTYAINDSLQVDDTMAHFGIVYKPDNHEYTFTLISILSSGTCIVSMSFDLETNIRSVTMWYSSSNGGQYSCEGEIYADQYSGNNETIYNYSCNNSLLSSSLKNMMKSSISAMLNLCGALVESSDTGVTMPMLGFKKF